jgi:hypothetical protein
MEKLKAGEKYLTIHIKLLGQTFKLTAFPNKEKANPREPDFKNSMDGVGVWISEKRAEGSYPPKKDVIPIQKI